MAITPTPSQGWSSFFSVTEASGALPDTVTETAVPAGAGTAIAADPGLTAAAFRDWTPTTQKTYLALHAPASGLVLTDAAQGAVPARNQTFRLAASGSVEMQEAGVTPARWTAAPSGGVAGVPDPAGLSATAFRNWDDASRRAYFAAASTTSPPSLFLQTTSAGRYEQFILRASVVSTGSYDAKGWQATGGMDAPGTSIADSQIPYYSLPGTAAGNTGTRIATSVDVLFPQLDGYTGTLPTSQRPANFDVAPTDILSKATPPVTMPTIPDINASAADKAAFKTSLEAANKVWAAFIQDFSTWHSSYQMEYVKRYGTVPAGGTQPMLEIPSPDVYGDSTKSSGKSGTLAIIPLMTALISSDTPRKLWRVESITKQDVALMSRDDQTVIGSTTIFAAVKQSELGLTTAAGKDAATQKLRDLMSKVWGGQGAQPGAGAMFSDPVSTDGTAARQVLKDELDLLMARVNSGALFSQAQLDGAAAAIGERADRLQAFYSSRKTPQGSQTKNIWNNDDNSNNVPYNVPTNVISLDNGAAVSSGFSTFLAQERRILEVERQRNRIAGLEVDAQGNRVTPSVALSGAGARVVTNGSGKAIDAPTLIYLLQDQYNTQLEAEVAIETEYVKQVNELLKTYAAMQDAVNRTLSTFDKINDGDGNPISHRLLNFPMTSIYDNISSPTEDNYARVFQMFNSGTSGTRHPVEILQGVVRPTEDMIGSTSRKDQEAIYFQSRTHSQWTTFGTRLNDAVTQLNQESQTRMNDINNKDKQRNRHYELANSALSKMNDALQGILRAMA